MKLYQNIDRISGAIGESEIAGDPMTRVGGGLVTSRTEVAIDVVPFEAKSRQRWDVDDMQD